MLKFSGGGLLIGAVSGGLLLSGPTIGNSQFAHETTQNSLSMFIFGAIPGSVLGLIIGTAVGIFQPRKK